MKLKLNHIIFALLIGLVFVACQNEEIEITDSNAQHLLEPNSTLANLMHSVTANENTSNSIACVDFVYPITVSIFDSEFNIIDTVTIANDDAFYAFLNNLENNDNALIVSLNFPMVLQYENGNTVEVNSNQEIIATIEAAQNNCEVDFECSLEDISAMLQECPWNFTDGTDMYNNLQMIFNQNGNLIISEGFATSAIGGSWNLSLSNDGSPELVITDLTAFSEGLEGSWIVVDCNVDGELTIARGDDILELDKDCSTVTFNCFENFDAVIELCDQNNDGIETFNLTTAFANCITDATLVTYHINQADAEASVNPIPNPTAYTNTTTPQEIYVRVEISNQFEVFTINLIVQNCTNTSGCSEEELNTFLLDCIWNATNYNGTDSLAEWNFDFEANSDIVVIYTATQTIDATWVTTQTNAGISIAFSNITAPNIQAITGSWLLVECQDDRLELHTDNAILVLEKNCN